MSVNHQALAGGTVDQTALSERVVRHIGEYLEADVSHLTLDSRPSAAIAGLDSLKLFEMFLYLEDCFGVEFDDSVMEHFETLGDLVGYIDRQLSTSREAKAV
jgi:acyl carrier protein